MEMMLTMLDLNQAWVKFSVTDDSSLKLGRQALVRGNGSIIGRHDHLQNPYSYDGWVFILATMIFPTMSGLYVRLIMVLELTQTSRFGFEFH